MKYKILREEAYVTVFSLNADFEYKGIKYEATCQYYNGGGGIEDIDVFRIVADPGEVNDEWKTLEKIAKEIFEDMNIKKYITH